MRFALLLLVACTKAPEETGRLDTSPDTEETDETGETGDTGDTGDTDPPDPVITCTALPAPTTGLCDVSGDPSTATHVRIRGTVLAPDAVYVGGDLVFDRVTNGTITCVGCDCTAPADTITLTCRDGVVSPGLINAHDHIRYALLPPGGPPGDERYDHRHDWRTGARGHTELRATSTDTREAVLWGELRQLYGGTTSVAGSPSDVDATGLLRNVDSADDEGLSTSYARYSTFPLGDIGGILRSSGCGSYDIESSSALSNPAYLPHIAEGIDAEARNEFVCLSSSTGGGKDLIASNTSIIHGIGLAPPDIALVAARGARLIWSPRSNVSLYGETAPVVEYDNLGVTIALGTDWTPSGSIDVRRELQCADFLDTVHYGDHFSDRDLWEMATAHAAIAVGQGNRLGVLATGYVADVTLFDGTGRAPFRAVIDAELPDVALVLRGSEPLHGDAALIEGLLASGDVAGCEAQALCGASKRTCLSRDAGTTLAALTAAVPGNAYRLDFCAAPNPEPTCEPLRHNENGDGAYFPISDPDDPDGDGVLTADDTCPTVFNPPRPLEGNAQGDWDEDGIGDVCDPCPLDASASCTLDLDDIDGDGTDNDVDNCPSIANNQTDADGDGLGAACDACDDWYAPDGACVATPYQVKQGAFTGRVVDVPHLLVTAVAPDGVYTQLVAGQPGFTTVDDAGLYVYLGSATKPARGDRITAHGTAVDFHGQMQLADGASWTRESAGNALPSPITVSPADIADGGSRAADLEASLVRVQNVTVTSITPAPGPSEPTPTREFVVTGNLRIDDQMYLVSPFPAVDATFSSITGVLRYSYDHFKVEPRNADDVIGVLTVAAFSGPVHVPAGGTATVDVRLSGPAGGAISVALSCGNGAVATCPSSVAFTAGQQSRPVTITAVATGSTTLVATFAGTASTPVVVYNDATPRVATSITPNPLTLTPNASATATLTLDLPAPSTGLTVAVTANQGRVTPSSAVFTGGSRTATFGVTAGSVQGVDTLRATQGATVTAAVTVQSVTVGTNLLFSQYMEGSGDNKIVEITSLNATPVDLSTCRVRVYANGAVTPNNTITLSAVSLAYGESYVVCHASEAITTTGTCDQRAGGLQPNGDDAVTLECGTEQLDVIGEIGFRPSGAWSANGVSTKDDNLVRTCVSQGDPIGTDDFDPSAEWTSTTMDDPSDLGRWSCTPQN